MVLGRAEEEDVEHNIISSTVISSEQSDAGKHPRDGRNP